MGEITQALAWLVSGRKGDAPDISGSALLYTDKGVAYLASTKWPGCRVKGSVAIGSGAQGALVAMRLGKSAEDAVRAVCGIDPCSGGEVDVLPVELASAKPKPALVDVVEAMAEEAWEVGNPDTTNAVLIFQDTTGKVRALRFVRGHVRPFAEAVMKVGAQMLDAPQTKN